MLATRDVTVADCWYTRVSGLYFGDDQAASEARNKRAYFGAGSPNGELSNESTPRNHAHAPSQLAARSRLPSHSKTGREGGEIALELPPTTGVQSRRGRGRPAGSGRGRGRPAGSGRGRGRSLVGAGNSSAEVPAASAMRWEVTPSGRTGRAAPGQPFGVRGADGRTSDGGSGRDRVSRLPGEEKWMRMNCCRLCGAVDPR